MLSRNITSGVPGTSTARLAIASKAWGESSSTTTTTPHYCAIALLVENTQPLHKVLKCATVLGLADVLMNGQEAVEVQHLGRHVCQYNILSNDLAWT